MHTSALIGQVLKDAYNYGWQVSGAATGGGDGKEFKLGETVEHNWDRMRDEIQNHIRSLNFGYRVQLREQKVSQILSVKS